MITMERPSPKFYSDTDILLDGVNVADVEIGDDAVIVEVRLRRRKLACPACEFTTWARYDTRPGRSSWRHLRLGALALTIRARLRRLVCPDHGVRVEGVDFARPGARFTRDFEQLVAWSATKMDKTALCALVSIDWDTVGRICDRVVADELDPGRLDDQPKQSITLISSRHPEAPQLPDAGRRPRRRHGRVGRRGQGHQDPGRVLRRARRSP